MKRKTDRDDALKLARLASVGELQAVPVPAVRQRKSLIGLRKRLVSERIGGQNRIRGLFVGHRLPVRAGKELRLAGGRWHHSGMGGFPLESVVHGTLLSRFALDC